ncbi:MAG: hypothetical protein Q4F31_10940, partial [Eubacteriales bacterium]|nr:hypothetical protein [Eubacteriales bacterium]
MENMETIRAGEIPDTEKRRLSGKTVIGILATALFAAIIGSFALGRYPVGIRELFGIIISRLPFVRLEQFWTDTQAIAV